ncbi:MAG: hypothetical protein ACK55I_51400 [bacterium]
MHQEAAGQQSQAKLAEIAAVIEPRKIEHDGPLWKWFQAERSAPPDQGRPAYRYTASGRRQGFRRAAGGRG